MKKIYLVSLVIGLVLSITLIWQTSYSWAVEKQSNNLNKIASQPAALSASSSAQASQSAKAKKIKKSDITQPTKPKNKLERALFQTKIKKPSLTNFVTYIIQKSVKKGLPVNTMVLILLLPLAASIIAILRHVVGLRGLGIFTPTVLSVSFISTGIGLGLIIFTTIVVSLTLVRIILKKIHLRIQYLPRMALIMVFISLSMIGLFYLITQYTSMDIYSLSIFPIIIMILLAESFMEIQIGRSSREAIYFTLQTLIIALLVYWVLTWEWVQILMIKHVEAAIASIILIDVIVGKYIGLRILEYWRFRRLVSSR